MFFLNGSKIRENLQALRSALVSLVSQTEEIERQIAAKYGISLLGEYRELIRQAADDDGQLVISYWLESAKETLGALGEPVSRSLKAWPGIYRSSLIDQLHGLRFNEKLRPYPIEFLNRLEPSTGIDQEFAYGILCKMAELREAEYRALRGRLEAYSVGKSKEVDVLAMAIGSDFQFPVDERGAKNRSLFVRRDMGGPFQFGLCLQEGRFRTPSLSYFDFVILERGGKRRLKSTGELDFASIGLEIFFPGYGPGYGIYSSPEQLRLNVHAAFCIFDVLSSFFDRCLNQKLNDRDSV